MCNYFIRNGSVEIPRKKEVRIFQKLQALPQTLHPFFFVDKQAGYLCPNTLLLPAKMWSQAKTHFS